MIYLASPYTHEYSEVMQMRYDFTLEITAYLIKKGYIIFSPIVHCHVIAIKYDLPKEYKFWRDYNQAGIVACDSLMIAAIDGWKLSSGVQDEYDFAASLGKKISIITPLLLGGYEVIDSVPKNPFK